MLVFQLYINKPSKVSTETSVLKFKGHNPVINDFTWTKFKHYLHTIIIWCIHILNFSWMCATVVEIMNRKIMMMEGWNRDDTICPKPYYGSRDIKNNSLLHYIHTTIMNIRGNVMEGTPQFVVILHQFSR